MGGGGGVRSKTQEFSGISETSENIFPRFFTPSFPFCTVPKTKNSDMKIWEIFSGAF